jgi:K+-sensing histidine kinase KdpD
MRATNIFSVTSPISPDKIRLQADVIYQNNCQENFWIDYPRELGSDISLSGNPWLSLLTPLAIIADASSALAKGDNAALKTATEQAYTDIASDIMETMATGSTYADSARIARDTLDAQCNDVIFNAIQNNEVAFGDLGKLIRKADKLASRLMACAYAVIMEAPSGKINKLEAYAAHLRRGYQLCRVSHMGLTARLSGTISSVTKYDDDASIERRAYEARMRFPLP